MRISLRKKVLKGKVIRFYLDIYDKGIRNYEYLDIYINPNDPKSIKNEKIELANNIRSLREVEYAKGENGFIHKQKQKLDFFDYYQSYLDNYNKRDSRMQHATFQKFKEFIDKPKLPIKKINRDLCIGFSNFLKSDECGLSGETPNNYWSRFKRVVIEAYNDRLLFENPTIGIKVSRKSNQIKKDILTVSELKILSETFCGNQTIKDAFLFACYTGLGQAEINNLTWENIKLPNKKIVIYRQKSEEQIINELPQIALNILNKYLPAKTSLKDLVFPKLPSTNGVNKTLQNWVDRAKIEKKITFYCARHSFAVMLLSNGANLKTVADCMGHASTQNTVKYLNYIDELKSAALTNLPQFEY